MNTYRGSYSGVVGEPEAFCQTVVNWIEWRTLKGEEYKWFTVAFPTGYFKRYVSACRQKVLSHVFCVYAVKQDKVILEQIN